jgi:hypothetical protein
MAFISVPAETGRAKEITILSANLLMGFSVPDVIMIDRGFKSMSF